MICYFFREMIDLIMIDNIWFSTMGVKRLSSCLLLMLQKTSLQRRALLFIL